MLIETLVAALAVMSVSLIGAVFVGKIAYQFLEKNLSSLVSLSAGVFLATAGLLIVESLELIDSILLVIATVLVGYALAWLLHRLLPEVHQHHDPLCEPAHHHGASARKVLVGDGVHNITDGMVLVAAFTASPVVGISVTVSIVIHELLQEISEYFVLRQAGYSHVKALGLNFLVSSTILIGVVVSILSIDLLEIETYLLGVSAGFLLQIVLHDLLPRRRWQESGKKATFHALLAVVGFATMTVINFSINELHSHGEVFEEHIDHV